MNNDSTTEVLKHKDLIDKNNIPSHIAIIMDGNGRWAKEKFARNRIFGHINGVNAVRATAEACSRIGVTHLTLYAFSTENWNRPSTEVNALMNLMVSTIRKEAKQLLKNNIRLNAIGDIDALPEKCYKELQEAIEMTKNNNRLVLTLALSYGSRWEITKAVQKMATAVQEGTLNPADIDEALISSHLETHDMPDPELLIRTSGHHGDLTIVQAPKSTQVEEGPTTMILLVDVALEARLEQTMDPR